MKLPALAYQAILMLVINSVAALPPTICISTPILAAEAGSVVKARFVDPLQNMA
jgi:hypothetical protein